MKRVLFCCFICLFLVSGCSFKDDNKLILVTEAGFAPYEFYQNGERVHPLYRLRFKLFYYLKLDHITDKES